MSPAKDLGTKYVCWKCETKFYDLHKPVPVCPKCGANQRERPAAKPARGSRAPAKAPPRGRGIAAVAAEPEEEEVETPADVEEDDDDVEEAAADEDDE